MKRILKILIGLLVAPFLGIAFIIATVRIIFTLTLHFAWETADEWHTNALIYINKKMKYLKD